MFKDTYLYRQEAIKFEETGSYCKHQKGTIASYRYWDEQARRCVHGYRPREDMPWISGYMYFYLNFCPIKITKDSKESKTTESGRRKAERTTGFPEFRDGVYEWFQYLEEAEQNGDHAVCLKSRGVGFSYMSASMCNRNYFLIPGSTSFVFAETKEYLTGDGILTKAWEMMAFIDQNTAWSKRRQVNDSILHKKASYKVKVNGVDTEKGFLSQIEGVAIGDDLDKTVRGKRGKLIVWEESGSNKHLLKGWMIAQQSMAEGGYVFGIQVVGGTGGSGKQDMMSLETLFSRPKGYRVHECLNKYELGKEDKKVGFFWPANKSRKGFMDADGNSFMEAAAEEIKRIRKIAVEESDPDSVIQLMAEEPLMPSEAMLRVNKTIFNLKLIQERIAILETDRGYQAAEFIGDLLQDEKGEIRWIPNDGLRPIREYPVNNATNMEGCVVIYEMPVKDDDGYVTPGLYCASADPFEDDKSDPNKKDSLGSVFVMNRLTKRLVAEYSGRPRFARDFYETTRRLIKFYNATLMYEQNKKGLFAYFDSMQAVHMLADNPKILRDMEMIRVEMSGNRAKGLYATEEVNKFGRELIKVWLESPAYGEEQGNGITNCHKIRSLPLLHELLYWDGERNTDRVSSLGLLMIYDMDLRKITADYGKKIRTFANSAFFDYLYTGKGVEKMEDVSGNSYNKTYYFDEQRGIFDLDK